MTDVESLKELAEDNNDFALALYGQLRQRPGNLFLSPFSIRLALTMTHAGTRGETAAQLKEVLRIRSSPAGFAEMIRQLDAGGGGEYEMAVANSLWSQDGAPLQPEFVDLISRSFGGGVNLVDFSREAEAARAAINEWVEGKTRQKIRELIPSDGVGSDTRVVLVNAVYFKGLWVLQFSREDTSVEPFHLEDGGTVPARLMGQHNEILHMQAEGYQAVDLVYQGADLSMLVLLPDEKDGLRDLEQRLSAGLLQSCVAQLRAREVQLFLPRFKITWGTVDLCGQLSALGITHAFNQLQADFSGINGLHPPHEEALFISNVFHKAYVEVDEQGTEAAAATAVAVTRAPSRPFRADHPFLFAIRDRKSGAILFLGRITDPVQES